MQQSNSRAPHKTEEAKCVKANEREGENLEREEEEEEAEGGLMSNGALKPNIYIVDSLNLFGHCKKNGR